MDIEDNFEEIFEEISDPIFPDEIYGYDEDEFSEDDDDEFGILEDWAWEKSNVVRSIWQTLTR